MQYAICNMQYAIFTMPFILLQLILYTPKPHSFLIYNIRICSIALYHLNISQVYLTYHILFCYGIHNNRKDYLCYAQ
jgi:hypothetical protein